MTAPIEKLAIADDESHAALYELLADAAEEIETTPTAAVEQRREAA